MRVEKMLEGCMVMYNPNNSPQTEVYLKTFGEDESIIIFGFYSKDWVQRKVKTKDLYIIGRNY